MPWPVAVTVTTFAVRAAVLDATKEASKNPAPAGQVGNFMIRVKLPVDMIESIRFCNVACFRMLLADTSDSPNRSDVAIAVFAVAPLINAPAVAVVSAGQAAIAAA